MRDVHREVELELERACNQNNIMEEELSEFQGSGGSFTPEREGKSKCGVMEDDEHLLLKPRH